MLSWTPAVAFGILLVCGLALLAISRSGTPPEPIIEQRSLAAMPAEADAPTRVDLNYATRAELQALPGIGAATADAIIARRAAAPIGSLHELVDAQILSERQRDAIADLVALSLREPPP